MVLFRCNFSGFTAVKSNSVLNCVCVPCHQCGKSKKKENVNLWYALKDSFCLQQEFVEVY